MTEQLSDEFFMRRCIQLAKLGKGSVSPNPMVGAVLVHEGKIISEGYHRKYGEAHAEVNCIDSVSPENRSLIPKSLLYVSLEPCSHFGKTPPCADLIVREKIPEVKIGVIDINQKVHGKGVKKLREAGIKVTTGICENECYNLNRRFFTFHSEKRPYIILKWAQSADGKIGKVKERVLISNTYSNMLVHKWRSEEDAILVGRITVERDHPQLTNRFWTGKSPVKILLAGTHVPSDLSMFSSGDQKTLIFNTQRNETINHINFIKATTENYLQDVMTGLYDQSIQSVLVEGGAHTLQSFFDIGFWDECRIITNTKMIIGQGIAAPVLPEVNPEGEENLLNDRIQFFSRPHSLRTTNDDK